MQENTENESEVLRGNATPATEIHLSSDNSKALIVEDIRQADIELRQNGYECDRMTHSELMSHVGTEYTGKLLKGYYSLLWISTPNDWYVRHKTKRTTAHWQRILHWIQKAILLGILVVLFGPPGFLWKVPNIQETMQPPNVTMIKMRLCHFGHKFDSGQPKPSGSYLQLATTAQLSPKQWQCLCNVPIQEHVIDWYGRSQLHAEWRAKITLQFTKEICNALAVRGNVTPTLHAIKDDTVPPLPISTSTALPTESRLRQKARLAKLKEAGLKPKKKHKVTEPGTDDCGDDISGLGPDVTLLSCDALFEDLSDDDDLFVTVPTTIRGVRDSMGNTLSAVAYLCYGKNNQVDLLELCGGAGRISQVAFRRGLTSGGNLDLVTGCDLGDPAVQKAINHYLDVCYVMVTVLQPNCRTVGRNSYYNSVMYHDTWKQHHQEDLPHLQYCGQVALKQMKMGRFFLREQPVGTWIDDIEPWPEVQSDDTVVTQNMDQCMADAKVDDGTPVQKPTEWTANDLTLVEPMQRYVCDQSHIHANPTGKALEKLKVYPWKLCGTVVTGIQHLKVKLANGERGNAPHTIYPTTGTGTDAEVPDTQVPAGGKGCPACAVGSLRRDSPMHTRDPRTCRWPDIAPRHWECPACQDDKYRNARLKDPGHTFEFDKCKFADRGSPPRVGAHPRDPRPVATTHPSAEASSHDAITREPIDEPPDLQGRAFGEDILGRDAISSGTSTGPHEDPESIVRGDATAIRTGRGPDQEPRERRTYASTGTGPARLPDWTRFNIQVSLRNLRSYNPTVVQRELRKLHLRWWHAREPKMRTILTAAGLDEVRLAMIKSIVDTCRECRAWQKRGNEVIPSVDIPTKFNEKGECDLMFYKRFIAFHIIDRAIRLSDGGQVENKLSETLLNAYATTWVQRNGAFQILYSDGELGLNNATSIAELKRLGTELRVRAPDQHARFAESRQSMLRHVMHMIEEELKRHNHQIPFCRLYAEALFVVNAFSFYNGVSPYMAHTGRQPAVLPDLENIDFPKGGEQSGGLREQRIREAGIEAITQSTAVAKVNRALKTSTTIDGSRLYKVGDLIDFHRPTATKDEHGGWNGPYPVVRNEPDQGKVVCAHGGREIAVRYPDARLTLFVELLMTLELGLDNEAIDAILNYIERLAAGKTPETFGYVVTSTTPPRYQLSTASRKAPKVFLALQFVIRNFFRIGDVFAIRLGKSVATVSKCEAADRSVLIYYTYDTDPDFHYYETKDTALDIRYITQSSKSRIIQCLVKNGCQSVIDDNAEVARELSHGVQPSNSAPDARGHSTPPAQVQSAGPPTPQQIEVGGELPTIQEGDDEGNADELIVESYYAELMSDVPLQPDPRFEETPPTMVQMMPEDTILVMATGDDDQEIRGNTTLESEEIYISDLDGSSADDQSIEYDDTGAYVEICFSDDMAPVILGEDQHNKLQPDEIATLRVYISENTKRAVVVKEDDLLSKKELQAHAKEVAEATVTELKTWLTNKCFQKCLLKNARNVMTSRYVAKWKWIQGKDGKWMRVIRMRLCLRGFMDLEAFSLDTFSGTAKRTSQRILASEAACHQEWIMASLDIDKAFLKGFTYRELAEATGENERVVCFKLPPGSAMLLRKLPGYEDFDETIHCLQCIKPGTGTKDAPRAFSLKLSKTTKKIGLKSTSYDPEFEIKKDLLTAKHVDDVNMTGKEQQVDYYTDEVEKVFGKCKLNKHQFTNCGVRHTMQQNHDVILDQDEYIGTLRPIVSPELTGAPAEKEATKNVTDLFVSLRGALAYTTLTQAWIQVYIVALQRIQQPTNLDVRRLNAITRKLQKEPKKLVFVAMKCSGHVDLHTDSGYRRITEAEDVKGYGMRGLCLLRRGERLHNKGSVVHLLESICRSHRLVIRSSYGAETVAASHGFDDAYPTLITLIELRQGVLQAGELRKYREDGGLALKVILTIDAEGVYKSVTSRDLKTPAEKTLLGHVCWIRELLSLGLVESIQWCDTRDMVADGHTKGSIDRHLLLEAMQGRQEYKYDVKRYMPYRKGEQAVPIRR